MKRVVGQGASIFAILSLVAVSTGWAQSKTWRIYVNVPNEFGADLRIDDLQITEGGVSQQVTKVELSNHPMRIALLVDTSTAQYQLADLRAGLEAFIDAIPSPHELLLVTTGVQVQVRVSPTSDRKKVKDVARGLFPETGGGGTLLSDALEEVDNRFMKKADDRSPVFVIVTGNGTESSQRFDERAFAQLTQSFQSRGVPVHAIVLSTGATHRPAALAMYTAQNTGGRVNTIGASRLLLDKTKALAASIVENDRTMAGWYQVDYVSTSADTRPVIEVSMFDRAEFRIQTSPTRQAP